MGQWSDYSFCFAEVRIVFEIWKLFLVDVSKFVVLNGITKILKNMVTHECSYLRSSFDDDKLKQKQCAGGLVG